MRAHLIGAALGAVLCLPVNAAEPLCGPLGLLEAIILEDHGEAAVAHQMTEARHILTAYVDPDDGSWTIIAHDGTGGCVIQGGYLDTLPASLLPFYGQGV